MKRRRSSSSSAKAGPPGPVGPDPAEIDRLYGLDPVFEPGGARADADGGHITEEEHVSVRCPYCGERITTRVDLSASETAYIEDCQVCCQPMELAIERAADGALLSVTARRGD